MTYSSAYAHEGCPYVPDRFGPNRAVGAGLVPALGAGSAPNPGTHEGCPYDSSHGTRAPVSSMTSTGFSGLYLSKVHISGFFRI